MVNVESCQITQNWITVGKAKLLGLHLLAEDLSLIGSSIANAVPDGEFFTVTSS